MIINSIAPDFTCQAIVDGSIKTVSLRDFTADYKVLFFYPLNFTFVCPTEMHALQEQMDQFKKNNIAVLAISVDSVHSHHAWLQMPRMQAGIAGITYPLLSDITKNIARAYGVLDEEAGVAYRGTFILDAENRVHHASINNLPIGRNIAEYIRLVQAIDAHKKNGEVCPANWKKDDPQFKPTHKAVLEYFSE